MKKLISIIMVFLLLVMSGNELLHASNFDGREDEMNAKCSVAHNKNIEAECLAYKDYLVQKNDSLQSQISNLDQQVNDVRGKLEETSAFITKNNEEIKKLTSDIEGLQTTYDEMQRSIEILYKQIEEKELSVAAHDEILRTRLANLQVYTGNNYYIDFLMGAESFPDVLRRTAVLSELNAYEQEQMDLLKKERQELEEEKTEVESKKDLLAVQQTSLENKRHYMEQLTAKNEELANEYRAKDADLTREKALAQVQSGVVAAAIPTISTDVLPDSFQTGGSSNGNSSGNTEGDSGGNAGGDSSGNNDDGSDNNDGADKEPSNPGEGGGTTGPSLSSGFIFPVPGGVYSAGTWNYPSGYEHLGIDFATNHRVGLNVIAPASGIVMATYDGVANHGIYEDGTMSPNRWAGVPAGGGNTLHMITEVNGVTYGISFYHLSPNMFNVSAGTIVSQGQIMAHTGHSGNSSGPHCHIEVIRLGYNGIKAGMELFYARGKDYGYGLWSSSKACSVTGTTPCLERPEQFFK